MYFLNTEKTHLPVSPSFDMPKLTFQWIIFSQSDELFHQNESNEITVEKFVICPCLLHK